MIERDPTRARDILRAGGIVAVPTETVYGLAALVHDPAAVGRVFAVKGRPRSHPLIVHIGRNEDPGRWGEMTSVAEALVGAFWPGPLTILLRRTSLVPDWVTGGRDTVAVRMPDHPLLLDLLDELDDALVAPSANRFGRVSPTTAAHVEADLGDEIDLVLDGGPCRVGVESTIIDCSSDTLQILRPGAIDADDIMAVCGRRPVASSGEVRAPGMLPSHYAPNAAVILCDDRNDADLEVRRLIDKGHVVALVWREDPRDYANRLYDDLRAADDVADIIVAVLAPPVGIGLAVRDRLSRAAHRREGDVTVR